MVSGTFEVLLHQSCNYTFCTIPRLQPGVSGTFEVLLNQSRNYTLGSYYLSLTLVDSDVQGYTRYESLLTPGFSPGLVVPSEFCCINPLITPSVLSPG